MDTTLLSRMRRRFILHTSYFSSYFSRSPSPVSFPPYPVSYSFPSVLEPCSLHVAPEDKKSFPSDNELPRRSFFPAGRAGLGDGLCRAFRGSRPLDGGARAIPGAPTRPTNPTKLSGPASPAIILPAKWKRNSRSVIKPGSSRSPKTAAAESSPCARGLYALGLRHPLERKRKSLQVPLPW